MIVPKLGIRSLSSFAAWATAVLWTLSYSAGAGFGAFQYVLTGGVLTYHPLFPPAVSVWQFVGNLASLWYSGLYDTGLTIGFFIIVGLLAMASQMKPSTVERVFSWPLAIGGGIILAIVGYAFEIHQTLALGRPHVPYL